MDPARMRSLTLPLFRSDQLIDCAWVRSKRAAQRAVPGAGGQIRGRSGRQARSGGYFGTSTMPSNPPPGRHFVRFTAGIRAVATAAFKNGNIKKKPLYRRYAAQQLLRCPGRHKVTDCGRVRGVVGQTPRFATPPIRSPQRPPA